MLHHDDDPALRLVVEIVSGGDAGTTELLCAGEIDMSTAPLLRARLRSVIDGGARHVVVDLEDVQMIDSTGLGTLVWARNRVDVLSVRGLSDVTRTVFTLTGLHEVIRVL